MMTLQEKSLYQQIHPLRLVVDWTAGLYACFLFWQGNIAGGVIAAFAPSLVVSLIVLRFADLEKIKRSRFGLYFARTYSKNVDMLRFAGFAILAGSSWYHSVEGMIAGIAVILGTWTYGIVIPEKISGKK